LERCPQEYSLPHHCLESVLRQGGTHGQIRRSGKEVADDSCPHEGGPLSEGQIVGEDIECPWHRSCFNIRTGRVTRDPATDGVATYRVRLTGDAVEVEV
jgi:nitrite reductase/ring-hydroxylating ferredoxin subunit